MTERSNSISLPSLFLQFLSLPFMALLTNYPSNNNDFSQHPPNTKRRKKQQKFTKQPSSWDQIKNLLTCKQIQGSETHDPSTTNSHNMCTSCSSMRTLRNAVHHSKTRVAHRSDNSPENGNGKKKSSRRIIGSVNSRSAGSGVVGGASYTGGGRGGMQLRKLSGCYECHAIVDPSRCSLPRTTICACSECGEVFQKTDSLELHQAVRHAVSEMGPEDSSRNIVEIIFKSSWIKNDNPICIIERILKVHNSQRTIQRFEDYRDAVKIRANSSAAKRNARCAADGNELLRFHCATLMCSLGARGSSSLCGSIPACSVCTIIRHGFHGGRPNGIRTTSSSGRAHDSLGDVVTRRAMLVCRVIAGRVKGKADDASKDDGGAASPSGSSYDSVAGCSGIYSNLEELRVYSSRAILPCFVVIYKALDA
ncbi:hypothetical protein OROHE_001347 [Orobanche hederae]